MMNPGAALRRLATMVMEVGMNLVNRMRLQAEDLHLLYPASETVKCLSLGADEVERQQKQCGELLDLLETIFDAYEDGPECYESPEDYAGYLGKAIRLDDTTFQRVADILNEHRPRTTDTVLHNALEVSGQPEAVRCTEG